MKRLVLINAYPDKHFGEENISVIVQMPLNLAYIAALTPRDEWEVDVIDETLERAVDAQGNLTFGHADLVGITAVTYQVPRLYEIAEACRRAGVPTIAGGAHATILPEEASNCQFGGPDGQRLFITATSTLWSLPVGIRGVVTPWVDATEEPS